MRNAKTLAIAVALGLGLIFFSPFAAQAKKKGASAPVGDEKESQAGGLPALEDRVEADEALITELETDVTDLENLVATALHRLSAEFQNEATGSVGGEVATNVGPSAGGTVVYDKTLSIPFPVAYITFSAQGDTHFGTALLMSASVTNKDGATTICQPMANAGGAAAFGAPWMTLMKLPTDPAIDAGTDPLNNCQQTIPGPTTISGDGGGGSADCHDNSLMFSCCVLTTPAASGDPTQDVKIKMASSLGTGGADTHLVFYENSTIYIDASSDASLCKAVSTAPH
jgi:hypothetical protein